MLAYSAGPDLDQMGARFDVARLSGEEDARLRGRIQQGYHLLAAAGPEGAYRQHALAVDASIADVSVVTLGAGQVTVTVLAPLLVDAATVDPMDAQCGRSAFPDITPAAGLAVIIAPAESPILSAVRARLSAEDVVPLTDEVIVRPPTVLPFTVEAVLTLYPGPDTAPVLSESRTATDAYLAYTRRMGFDVTVPGLLDALVVPGVQDVRLSMPPADVVVGPTEVALCLGIAITSEEARTQ